MSRDPNPYRNQNPLPFPVADQQFNREREGLEMQSARISPTKFTASREPINLASGDVMDSAEVQIPRSHIIPTGHPDLISSSRPDYPENSATRVVVQVAEKTHVPEEERFRYFLSCRTIIELLSVLAAMIPIIVAPHLGAYQRGFQCDDPNIMYPFKEGTVKPWLLYLVGLLLPFVTVVIGEYCRFYVSKTGYGNIETKYRMWRNGPRIPPMLVSIARIVLLFTYGFLIVKSVTDIAKYTVGRLRPHFLDVCRPDWALMNQTHYESRGGSPLLDSGSAGNCRGRYILAQDLVCTMAKNNDPKVQYRLRDSRLSFMSGHASMAFYSMFFLIFYLESRLRWMQMRYCKAILQFGLFMLAALTGLSRISDHKHHWDDVFTGALLGIIGVLITVFVIGDFFNDSRFLRYKIVTMLQKLDWDNHEGSQFARLLSEENGKDPGVIRKIKHITRYPVSKSS